jgi:hypothetical protein
VHEEVELAGWAADVRLVEVDCGLPAGEAQDEEGLPLVYDSCDSELDAAEEEELLVELDVVLTTESRGRELLLLDFWREELRPGLMGQS